MKLYTWTTPNGRKIAIALEEMGIAYEAIAVDITKDEQHTPEFAKINPAGKIPALVDGDKTVVESGAILLYLAEKSGLLAPAYGSDGYWRMMQWLMWQMSAFGPMLGQAHHFLHYNRGKSEYSEARYHAEACRLYSRLDNHLSHSPYILDELSIADISIWPWAARFGYHQIDLNDFPAVKDWYLKLADRPAFKAGYQQKISDESVPMPAPGAGA